MINNWIKSYDFWAYSPEFNIDNKGPSHKTWIGGFFSLIIQLVMYAYLYLLFYKMIMREEDLVQYKFPDIDIEELGVVKLDETD